MTLQASLDRFSGWLICISSESDRKDFHPLLFQVFYRCLADVLVGHQVVDVGEVSRT